MPPATSRGVGPLFERKLQLSMQDMETATVALPFWSLPSAPGLILMPLPSSREQANVHRDMHPAAHRDSDGPDSIEDDVPSVLE